MADARTEPSAEERLQALIEAVYGFLDALEAEASARASLDVALNNFSDPQPERRRYLRDMSAAMAARGRLVAMLPPRDPSHRRFLARPTTDR